MFYEKVRQYCEQNKLTIMGFESLCGLSNGSVSKWKDGSFPSIPTLKKIEEATKISVDDWLK